MPSAKLHPGGLRLYRWRWRGKGPGGRRVGGEIVAARRAEVERLLDEQRVTVTSIRRRSGGMGRVSSRDVTLLARQMAAMIHAGVPILQALQVIADGSRKPAVGVLVRQLMDGVSAGSGLCETLGRHPRHFDPLFRHLVAAGEQSGTLDLMLERVALHREKLESLRARVKKALWYPAAVTAVGIAVTALLLIEVVPQFESLFHGFGAELPPMTRLTIAVSEQARQHWKAALLSVALSAFVVNVVLRRSESLARRLHAWSLYVPVIGGILDKAAVARFSRTLATTFGAGVPLVEALESAAGATGNLAYQRAVRQMREDVSAGQSLRFAMRMTERFPALAVQMVGIGEESGSLNAMLDRVATHYEEEVDRGVDALTSLLEPVIIVVLGILVGGLVISMYLPIFELGSVL